MPIQNQEIAEQFNRLADLLEIEDANEFRVRAYRNAARTVESLPRGAREMLEADEDLSELPGIGDDLAGKIKEIVDSGELSLLKDVEKETASELSDLMKLPGIGPKRVQVLHEELKVASLADLKQAAEDQRIRHLEGFGKKTEEKILREIGRWSEDKTRTKLVDAIPIARSLKEYLSDMDGVKEVVVAGSFRRRKETVGDLDILVTCRQDSPVMDRFVDYEDVEEVVSKGKTRSTAILRSGLRVDLRVVAEVCYGAALFYFTGSKQHNIAVRKMAQDWGLKINEYGVFDGDDRFAGATEQEVYSQVNLPYIPPELREGRGEINAAKQDKLPQLVERTDLRGNLHTHTTETDGKYSLKEMAEAANEHGLEYLAITDHSQAVAMADGLDEKRLREQIERIDALNDELSGIRILKGIEVDILEDGSLDLDDDALSDLDVVVGSIHSNFHLSKTKQTERVIRGMDHSVLHILGHPTGRLINRRKAYEIDMEQVVEAARERGCHLELNAQPDRLDINDVHCQLAKEVGVKVAISADAHTKTDLEFLRFGVDQARRGWLEADDVLNTRNWGDLKNLLKRD